MSKNRIILKFEPDQRECIENLPSISLDKVYTANILHYARL